MQDDASDAGTVRAGTHTRENEAVDMEIEAELDRNLENDLAAADGFGEAMDLVPSQLSSRATKMFTEGIGAPRRSGEHKIAKKPTLWLVKLAREVVAELFAHHRERVQESWGTMLDQEEALGFLICDALGCELLAEEARTIGKQAAAAINDKRSGAKVKDAALKSGAAAKRANARKAAVKHPDRREDLAEKLADIDAKRESARAALWGEEVKLPLPPPDSKVVVTQPVAAAEPMDPAAAAAAAADAELGAAVAADAAAAEAKAAAEEKLAAAERAARASSVALRALEIPGVGSAVDLNHWLGKQEEAHLALDGNLPQGVLDVKAKKIWEALDPLDKTVDEAKADGLAAGFDWIDARRARVAALARVQELAAQAAESERQQAAAERERLQALMAQKEAEIAERERAELEAERRLAETQARIRELEAGQRVAVHAHAAHIWGAGWQQQQAAPKIIKLTGKSADEVAAMAGQVSQVETSRSTAERRALNDNVLNQGPLRVGC